MAADYLKSQQQQQHSEYLAASGALDFDLPAAYHRDPSSNMHESVHSQPAKKSRSRWF
jgi:hypothetical protein